MLKINSILRAFFGRGVYNSFILVGKTPGRKAGMPRALSVLKQPPAVHMQATNTDEYSRAAGKAERAQGCET